MAFSVEKERLNHSFQPKIDSRDKGGTSPHRHGLSLIGRCNFSDERRLSLLSNDGVQRVWRTKNEADIPTLCCLKVSKSVSVMEWGCIGPNGVGRLVVCNRNVDSTY